MLLKAAQKIAQVSELTPRAGSKTHLDVTINGKAHIIERLPVTQRLGIVRTLGAVLGGLEGVAGKVAGGAAMAARGDKQGSVGVFVELAPSLVAGLCSPETEAVIVNAAKKAKRKGDASLEAYGENIDLYVEQVEELLALGLVVLEVNCGDFLQRLMGTIQSAAEATDVPENT